VQQGSLPIILTAPHGGRERIAGVESREMITEKVEASRIWGGFQRGGDLNTDILVQKIASEIKALLGRDVYLVMAKFDRRFIDANRPAELAFDGAEARPYYDLYHGSIRRFVNEVRREYPAALLIDVHGQGKDPEALMRGTSSQRLQGLSGQ
jgi:N-formylglutamate amidohydrolase